MSPTRAPLSFAEGKEWYALPSLLVLLSLLPGQLWSQEPSHLGVRVRVISSIPGPESVAVGPDGAWYVSAFGKFDNGADGGSTGSIRIRALARSTPADWRTPWRAVRRLHPVGGRSEGVYRVTRGNVELVYPAKSFPRPLHFLNDLAAGPGRLTLRQRHRRLDRCRPRGGVPAGTRERATVVACSDTVRAQSSVNGLFPGSGDTFVHRRLSDGGALDNRRKRWLAGSGPGLGSPDGIDAASGAAFYISDNVGGDLFLAQRKPAKPVKIMGGLKAPADLVVDRARSLLVVPENDGNRLTIYRISDMSKQ